MRFLLLGLGSVGKSFLELVESQKEDLRRRYGLTPRLVGVVDSKGSALCAQGIDPAEVLKTKEQSGTVGSYPKFGNPRTDTGLIEESPADIVIEATPTNMEDPTPALQRLQASFRTGKHVVSVNKGPLAVALPALQELCEYNEVAFRFSGTVGGGTPMLPWARECTRGDEVVRIQAILNGTTNYILTEMEEKGVSFASALGEAQALGYAETDPSADVDGIDAATKLVIIANHILAKPTRLGDIHVEGIREIKLTPEANTKMKLIAEIGETMRVTPQRIPADSPLNVGGSLNAITLTLKTSGEVTLVGRGAGGPETATAILRDWLDIWLTHPGRKERGTS
ncbi:MAG: homoserine dehydrogenase [Planctomycetota bacterium]|jgi:homoserine dehydrogenase|nr:homoserine dehydrogenase [Planctomycetota bacterium]